MTVNRAGNHQALGGFMGQLPSGSVTRPTENRFAAADWTVPAAAAASRGVDDHALEQLWVQKTTPWLTREVGAAAVNRAAAVRNLTAAEHNLYNAAGLEDLLEIGLSDAQIAQQPLTYAKILHLGDQTLNLSELSWSKYVSTVKNNLAGLREALRPGNIRHFFDDVTPRRVLRETVVENNVQPIRDLFSENPDKNLGTGFFRLLAFGLIFNDILNNTRQAHHEAALQEDGTLAGKLNTLKETALALGKYTLRSAVSWEAGGIAFAIGRVILPVAIQGIPVGGIILGALGSALFQSQVLDPLLNTGRHDSEPEPPPLPGTPDNPFQINATA